MNKHLENAVASMLSVGILFTFSPFSPQMTSAPAALMFGETALATSLAAQTPIEEGKERLTVTITAYSSTRRQTDDTPFITALGTSVRDGVVAANFLPFGTRVKIPKLFGDKIFIVEDRMHARKSNFIDIWMPSKTAAAEFGINYTQVVVLD